MKKSTVVASSKLVRLKLILADNFSLTLLTNLEFLEKYRKVDQYIVCKKCRLRKS